MTELIRAVSRSITTAAVAAATALLLAPAAAGPAHADSHEEKPASAFTRIAMWEVDRDHWDDFVEMFDTYDRPIMEKLFADGTITEWGLDATVLHQPDDYTHTTWYSAPSMSALAKAGIAYEEAWKALGIDVDEQFNAMIGRHRDVIIETEGMRSKAVKLDGGFFQGHTVRLSSWDSRKDFMSYWKNRMAPVYEGLLADGAIAAYGVSSEAIATDDPRMITWWYLMPDADGFDKVEAAFDASWGDMDEEGRRARWLSILDTVEEDTYRGWATAIIHTQMAAH